MQDADVPGEPTESSIAAQGAVGGGAGAIKQSEGGEEPAAPFRRSLQATLNSAYARPSNASRAPNGASQVFQMANSMTFGELNSCELGVFRF